MKQFLLLFSVIFFALLSARYVYEKFIKGKMTPDKNDPYYSKTYEDPHGDGS